MRRLAALALALWSMAPPPARAQAPLSQSLSPIVSASQYGVSGDPSKDATAAIEAALARAGQLAARAATSASQPTSLLRLPGGAHAISRPLFIPDGVDMVGDGWSTRLEMAGVKRFPALVYGIKDPGVVSADRPDLFGVLDASAVPTAGARRGWSTLGGRTLQGQYLSANIGPWTDAGRTYFGGATAFVLDVALVRPSTGWQSSVPLMGCGQAITITNPRPWTLWINGSGQVVLSLRTTARAVGFAVTIPDTSTFKLSIQVDFAAGTAAAWVNGLQVALVVDGLEAGQTMEANGEGWPLHLGVAGWGVHLGTDPPTKLTLAGLHIATAVRYAVGSTGSAQTKIGGGAVNDAFRFFDRTDQTNTVGFFPFTDPAARRWLAWTPGDGMDECAIAIKGGNGGGKPARLLGLQIYSRGPGVLLGAVLDWRGSNLRIQSDHAAAVASIPIVMAYPITLNGCTLGGGDAAVSLSQALVAIRDCTILGTGRDGIRLRGASLDLTNVLTSFCPTWGQSFLRAAAGGEGDVVIRLERSIIDFEDQGPHEATIVVEPEPQHPTLVRITDISTSLTGPSISDPKYIVKLIGTTTAPARCVVDGVASAARLGTVTATEAWTVDVVRDD